MFEFKWFHYCFNEKFSDGECECKIKKIICQLDSEKQYNEYWKGRVRAERNYFKTFTQETKLFNLYREKGLTIKNELISYLKSIEITDWLKLILLKCYFR